MQLACRTLPTAQLVLGVPLGGYDAPMLEDFIAAAHVARETFCGNALRHLV
ncbi:MAG TPA: hypothetical protein VJU59_49260 [Paraburkholderia sp.]|nr:hypothetical protein [Paraburkholderia sp.]